MLALGLPACTQFDESGLPGSSASLARDRVMLVHEDPETFGYSRIQSLLRAYSGLEPFIVQRGMPGFLAETRQGNHEYLIFYYLEQREAYALKVERRKPHRVAVSGPYPITDSEYEILDGFRKTSL